MTKHSFFLADQFVLTRDAHIHNMRLLTTPESILVYRIDSNTFNHAETITET